MTFANLYKMIAFRKHTERNCNLFVKIKTLEQIWKYACSWRPSSASKALEMILQTTRNNPKSTKHTRCMLQNSKGVFLPSLATHCRHAHWAHQAKGNTNRQNTQDTWSKIAGSCFVRGRRVPQARALRTPSSYSPGNTRFRNSYFETLGWEVS